MYQSKLSLGLKQLQFPILLLIFGIILSIALGFFERILTFLLKKRKLNLLCIKVQECTNSNTSDNIVTEYLKKCEQHSIQEQIQELNLMAKEINVFLKQCTKYTER